MEGKIDYLQLEKWNTTQPGDQCQHQQW
jgi:hypothetical protein